MKKFFSQWAELYPSKYKIMPYVMIAFVIASFLLGGTFIVYSIIQLSNFD